MTDVDCADDGWNAHLPCATAWASDSTAWSQVSNFTVTMVCLRVATLKECLDLVAATPGVRSCAPDLHKMILWKLRQTLAARAAGQDVTLASQAPIVHAEAIFDEDCPAALRYELRQPVSSSGSGCCPWLLHLSAPIIAGTYHVHTARAHSICAALHVHS